MSRSETESIVELQHRVRIRLAELGFPPGRAASNIERHLAEIAVLARAFTEDTLPLFLSLSTDHDESLSRLAVSIKCDLEELRDALTDVEPDLIELMQFLNRE
ncbi:MAG TPA: hypothetical protein VN622_02495 [Clostridia bacterium]|nr:hypothetical protein [Clostridia bacterium]